MRLHSYQMEGVRRLLGSGRAHALNYEMGLGKTPTAIEAFRRYREGTSGLARAIVVCPAMVRENWRREVMRWAPELTVAVVDGTKTRAAVADVVIVSYEGLRTYQAGGMTSRPFILILDELHYLKNSGARRTRDARTLALNANCARVWGLSATLVPNAPLDLWSQLDVLFGGGIMNYWQFRRQYCLQRENPHATSGVEYYGLRPDKADELRERLEQVAHRVTKADVASILPPLLTQPVYIKTRKKLPADLDLSDLEGLEAVLLEKVPSKAEEAARFAQDLLATHTNVCILTHRKATAVDIGARLASAGYTVTVVTGDIPPAERARVIESARAKPGALVCTMHSVGIGIDLTFCTAAVFAELYWRPADMIQACGRFHRLSSTEPANVYFLCFDGSFEERMVYSLMSKLNDLAAVTREGVTEGALGSGLGAESEAQALDRLKTLDFGGNDE